MSDNLPVVESRVAAADGAMATVWRLDPPSRPTRATPVVVLPGFGRRMRHMAVIARQLCANGFVVYRTDLLNHVGMSDGSIERFTMGGALDGVRAVVTEASERDGAGRAIVLGASLSFRLAVRLAAEGGPIVGLVGLVGVVDTRYTLAQAFEADFFSWPRSRWPDFAEFEGHRIASEEFGPDCLDSGWLELEGCMSELEQVACPVVNFCGANDRWVRMEDIRRAFEPSAARGRTIVEIPDVEHELAKNPAAANEVLRDVVRYALAFEGASVDGANAGIAELSFDEMAAQAIFERQHESQSAERTTR